MQVTTVEHAEQAAQLGADVIIAQGGEAGGYGVEIATTVLVPQVVHRVDPVPVVAAGGFVDGCGLVAALALGACGVSIGTRFLATEESPIHAGYRQRILAAGAADAVKSPRFNFLSPNPGAVGYGTVVRVLRTPFVERVATWSGLRTRPAFSKSWWPHSAEEPDTSWWQRPDRAQAGSTVSMPAGEVVHQIIADAEDVLARLAGLITHRLSLHPHDGDAVLARHGPSACRRSVVMFWTGQLGASDRSVVPPAPDRRAQRARFLQLLHVDVAVTFLDTAIGEPRLVERGLILLLGAVA